MGFEKQEEPLAQTDKQFQSLFLGAGIAIDNQG